MRFGSNGVVVGVIRRVEVSDGNRSCRGSKCECCWIESGWYHRRQRESWPDSRRVDKGWRSGWMGGWVDGWMVDGWMGGWGGPGGGWMDGWMDGWVGG